MRIPSMPINKRAYSNAVAVALALCLPYTACAEQLSSATFSNFQPADQATVERFSCVGGSSREPDVVVEYGVVSTQPPHHESRLRGLSVRGTKLSAQMLSEINGLIGKDTLSSVSAGCSNGDIRVVLQVFRPNSIAPDACLADANHYLYIYYRDKTKTLSFE